MSRAAAAMGACMCGSQPRALRTIGYLRRVEVDVLARHDRLALSRPAEFCGVEVERSLQSPFVEGRNHPAVLDNAVIPAGGDGDPLAAGEAGDLNTIWRTAASQALGMAGSPPPQQIIELGRSRSISIVLDDSGPPLCADAGRFNKHLFHWVNHDDGNASSDLRDVCSLGCCVCGRGAGQHSSQSPGRGEGGPSIPRVPSGG